MPEQQKRGNTGGVRGWSRLDSLRDARLLLRWAILSFRDGTLNLNELNAVSTAVNVLKGVLVTDDLEKRLERLEQTLALHQQNRNGGIPHERFETAHHKT